jgi:type II restriction enzyme
MTKKNQSKRLTNQHKESKGVVGIFGDEAKSHDITVGKISLFVIEQLEKEFPQLSFQYKTSIKKEEINEALKKIDPELGQTLFVSNSSIIPDGGIIEVKDDNGNWRIVLVSEAKHQGKDIENIKAGKLVGAKNDQDLMAAGNAIERSHKNISEIANLMLSESHFPYVLFLEGSNFLTETISIKKPDGRVVTLEYNSGTLNRLDRLTSANYGMPINTNLCKNKFVKHKDKTIMLQAASIYTQGNGEKWDVKKMFDIMLEISKTSLKVLGSEIFNQITSGVSPETTNVSAVSSLPGAASLFVVGLDGRIWSKFYDPRIADAKWSDWFPLGDNTFPPTSVVTAISGVPGGVTLFVVGHDRKVWSQYYDPRVENPAWSGWFPL